MSIRPLALISATTTTLVVAAGAVFFGAFLIALAAGVVGSDGALGRGIVLASVGVAALTYGAFAIVAGGGLWLARPWAVPLAAAVHLIALAGVLVAASTGGMGTHIAVGASLALGGLAGVLAPETRGAVGA